MFILGIFVGRGTAPIKFDIEKLQKELIALKEENSKKEKEKYGLYMAEAQKKTNLGFYEALKKNETETDFEASDLKHPDFQSKKNPAVSGIPSRETTGSNSQSNKNRLTIQIASLRDATAADAMIKTLIAQGYQGAYRSVGNVPGKGIWYRVRIGYFVDKSEAELAVKRLIKDKYTPFIVRAYP